ncbi:hypothetical protein EUX98_g1211 [Antrodiella citrinella]|uniref:Adenylyl cyclase-associated protein n=1 Tax=Antrodiella citrinella TaxID=2447956 RepID=A0A4S4N256_9APHY|nr:hypothetical protein EUX98_g1211 [Antrodiella citrinella]
MSSSGGLHSLATIIKRLEAATSRLEDLAALGPTNAPQPTGAPAAIASQASSEPTPVPPPHASVQASSPPVEIPKSVLAYDERVIDGKVKPFVELTKSFAIASVIDQAALVEKEYVDLRGLILCASACKKPADDAVFAKILDPLKKDIEGITRAKETNRKDRDWFNHLNVVAEGGTAVGWVTVSPKPAPFVKDVRESTEFYANKVIKEFKEKDPKHAQWARAYLAILDEMKQYIMDFHTTGLGVSIDQYRAPGAASSGSAAAPPPPPPPPPMAPPPPPAGALAPAAAAGGIGAVFADLNRGEDVTKGLRKVDKSEMTHKNPTLRASSVVSAAPSSSTPAKRPIKPSKPQSLMSKKPSKFALEGTKWVVEYQEGETLTVEEAGISQTVNLYGCKNSTIIIKGKVNAVTIVNCLKTSILVHSVISSVSVTNSPSFALQITGAAPTIQLDSTDSGQIYLSKECLGVEITTAKCSSINVSTPVEGEEEGVFDEHPIPEMFRTVVQDGKLVTNVVEHSG